MYYLTVKHFNHWQQRAQDLLCRNISPDQVDWGGGEQMTLRFDDVCYRCRERVHSELALSPAFLQLAGNAACHRDESKWSLLYSLAWRMCFENPDLLDNKIDPQVVRLMKMQKQVGRDKHKMKAFVRFCRVGKVSEQAFTCDKTKTKADDDWFVAWFEPEHFILASLCPFFIKRFNNMNWSILTPDQCVHWDQSQLTFTKGVLRRPEMNDTLEDLWRTYYSSIFNPARLKLKAMQAEMPKKYWKNLPEAELISELTRIATSQMENMLDLAEEKQQVFKS